MAPEGQTATQARVEAVLAQPRQVHHERVFELAVDVFLNPFEIDIFGPLLEFAAENLLPVWTPLDLLHALAGDGRAWAGGRKGLQFLCGMEMLVVEGERLVVVVDFRQIRIGEDVGEDAPFGAHLRLDAAILLAPPSAVPLLLVFPLAWVTDTRFRLDIVEPSVFDAFPVGPYVLACDGTGMAPDALVEVQHHRNLSADLHSAASLDASG